MNKISLEPIERRRLYEDIVSQLKDMVIQGKLEPGAVLPSERELAAALSVSRGPVREALRALEAVGAIEVRHGKRSLAKGVSLMLLLDAFDLVSRSTQDAIEDLAEVRMMLESSAAALAAERRDERCLRKMLEAQERMEREIAAGGKGIDASMAFHMAIAQATGNKILYRLMQVLADLLRESRERSMRAPGRPTRALNQHREILEAIVRQDPEGARIAMYNHLSEALASYEAFKSASDADPDSANTNSFRAEESEDMANA